MDPGLRRDDGWGVSRYKGTLQRDTHFVYTFRQDATKGHSLCLHRQASATCQSLIRQRYATMDPGVRRDDDLRVCS